MDVVAKLAGWYANSPVLMAVAFWVLLFILMRPGMTVAHALLVGKVERNPGTGAIVKVNVRRLPLLWYPAFALLPLGVHSGVFGIAWAWCTGLTVVGQMFLFVAATGILRAIQMAVCAMRDGKLPQSETMLDGKKKTEDSLVINPTTGLMMPSGTTFGPDAGGTLYGCSAEDPPKIHPFDD